jgi:hypothetical protein
VCCTKEGLKFDETEEEKKAREELAASFEPLCRIIKDILGDKVGSWYVPNATAALVLTWLEGHLPDSVLIPLVLRSCQASAGLHVGKTPWITTT